MTEQGLGKLSRLSAREVWDNEAQQFTPWLADNLPLLNDALGLQIELIERERQVGSFAVDIFARDVGSGADVVIENQLAPTDHGHLGQLLTYAAGLEAKIVIWISPSFRDEHSQAIDWLNRHTPPEISFFAVELELLRIDNSLPAPHFKVVAEPSEFQKEVASDAIRSRTPRELALHAFSTDLLKRITSRSPDVNVRSVSYSGYLGFGTGRTGFNVYGVIAKGNALRVELYISTGNATTNRQALDKLCQHKADIEAALGQEFAFEQMAKDCRIYVRYPTPVDPANPPDGALDWAAEQVVKFREVFGPRVKSLQLEATGEPQEPSP
ncbi:MAG: DUF4268 domain-containing protein [Dehalococcoidia bacterium]|nr:DUF4268 domain-containing protein [Dehalococcoidia bacterium]